MHSAYYNGVLNFLRFHISWSFLDFFLIVFSVTDVQSVSYKSVPQLMSPVRSSKLIWPQLTVKLFQAVLLVHADQ